MHDTRITDFSEKETDQAALSGLSWWATITTYKFMTEVLTEVIMQQIECNSC